MIAGQVFDMELTGKEGSEDKLLNMIIGKTSRLIALPILISSLKANKNHYDTLLEFGIDLGILFQITDDILDVESDLSVLGKTPHKDEEENKVTAIKVFGKNGAKEKAKFYYEKCKSLISSIPNSDFLLVFTDNLYLRNR